MQKDKKDEKIINMLQDMPNIEDKKRKESLYHDVLMNIGTSKQKSIKYRKKRPFIPIFASFVTLSIVLISFVTFHSNSQESEQATEATVEDHSTPEIERYENNENNYRNDATEEEFMDDMVVHSKDHNRQIVYGAIPDEQHEYMIPISFIVSNTKSINEHYNNLQEYMQQQSLPTEEYLLEEAVFSVEQEQQEVKVQLPDDFEIGVSSAQAYELEQMLSVMFSPFGIKRAVFETKNEEGIKLEPYGFIKELPLKEEKASYKLYQERYLIPVPNHSNASIKDAIQEMKHGDTSYHIHGTIPNDFQFHVSTKDKELILEYKNQQPIEDNDKSLRMIEAILMTAKSYGFDTVLFDNMPIEQIGEYRFDKTIDVPQGVNPIDMRK